MFKMLVGFSIGILLAGALMVGPLNPLLTKGQEEPVTETGGEEPVAADESYDIRLMLKENAANIDDPETKDYYLALMDEYRIEDLPAASELTEDSTLLEVLPDMEQISNAAVTMPLEQAGKGIKDADIAEFYYQLLQDVGWNITGE